MKSSIGSWLLLVAIVGVALYLSWLIIAPFVDVLIWATVLAVVSFPVYQRWRRRGRSPAAAALLTTIFVILVIVVPLALVGTMVARQIPQVIDSAQENLPRLLDPNSRVYRFVDDRVIDIDQFRNREYLAAQGKRIGALVASRSLSLIGDVLGAVIEVFFVLFTLYYLLKDSDRIVPAIRDSLPLERNQADAVFRQAGEVISASVNGVLVIAAIQGTLGGIAFFVFGLPSAVLWGVVMFLLSMIPMAGSAIVWVPAAIYLVVTGHWIKATLLVVWGAGVIGMLDNVLRPRLVGERTRLHELIIFFSVLGGLQVFGISGLVVGPVVIAVTLSLVEVFRQMARNDITASALPAGK